MKTKLLALALLALSASAQTFTCVGCTDYGVIQGTPYTMQYGAKMVWTATVEPGVYLIDLTFVEPIYTTKAQRPLNVWVNDAQVLFGFDVIGASGPLLPYLYSRVAIVSGGRIVVTLTANDTGTIIKTKHSAIVSVISVTKLTGGGSGPATLPDRGCTPIMRDSRTLSISGCIVKINRVPFWIPPGTVSAVSGTGVIRGGIDTSVSPAIGRVYASRSVSVGCAGMGGCAASQQSESFDASDIQLFTWSVSNGTFDSNGYTDLHATESTDITNFTSLDCIQAGSKIRCSPPTQ